MLQKGALIVDYGPGFLGQATKIDSGIVCVVPSQRKSRTRAKALMRELVQDLGGECGACLNCPLGKQG
jgi:hypothetical protein